MRVLVMGAPYEVVSHKERTAEDCFAATGQNTGNLLIGNGVMKQLKYEHAEPFRYSMTPEYIEENFDQVVIAAANFLHPRFDFSMLSNTLEKIKLPVFMVGLGAQLPTTESELTDIPKSTWRLVQIAAERSTSIGVRGYFTADVVRKYGISNVRVTGCPSFYTNVAPSARLRRTSDPIAGTTVVNGSRNVFNHASDKQAAIHAERALFDFAFVNKRPYVLQNEQPEIQLSTGGSSENSQADIIALAKFFSVNPDEFENFFRAHGKTFFSVQEWFTWISEFDFSIGTRFHGNLAALLNGVPAVVIVHDSRTRELCEFAAIPHVFIQDLTDASSLNVQQLYDNANFDLFEERYNALHRKYIEFLNENSMPHHLVFTPDLPPRGRINL